MNNTHTYTACMHGWSYRAGKWWVLWWCTDTI